jgi:hypothetical protein
VITKILRTGKRLTLPESLHFRYRFLQNVTTIITSEGEAPKLIAYIQESFSVGGEWEIQKDSFLKSHRDARSCVTLAAALVELCRGRFRLEMLRLGFHPNACFVGLIADRLLYA